MKYADFQEALNETASTLLPPIDTNSDEKDDLFVAKISSMALLGGLSFILGILPIKLASLLRWKLHGLDHQGRHPLVISLLLCFGGGVLLNTTLMHLLPEVREGMQDVIDSGTLPKFITESGINLAELIFCIGFFFVYLIEETVHALMHGRKADLEVLHRSLSVRKCTMIPRISLAKPSQQSPPSTITASTQVLIRGGDLQYKNNCVDPLGRMTPPGLLGSGIVGSGLGSGGSSGTEASETSSAAPSEGNGSNSVGKSFRGLLAVIALSFHAVFEGLAIGLEMDPKSVWYLCAAVATHKLVIAFCIGIELVTSRTRTLLIVIYMATFAVVSPLGIGIGLAMSHDTVNDYNSGLPLASVVLQGMAAGTLLYVIFFEVLQREKSSSRYGLVQLFAIISGFVVLLALGFFIGEHSHDHGHSHQGHHHHHSHHQHEHDHEHMRRR